ncbi:hypothetical protein [Brevundimonas sp.]|uniref:hypothetical protein n=1 Tax=Brevundimonas sp. TaxID=1871086 RepID=UPI0035AF7374
MSAIRPPVPSPLFPTQTPAPPVRAGRASFFQAALDGLMTAPPAEVAPLAAGALPAPAAAPERPGRPGALLDIRV